jgi:tetratricopeptide (TPR) repeat protein
MEEYSAHDGAAVPETEDLDARIRELDAALADESGSSDLTARVRVAESLNACGDLLAQAHRDEEAIASFDRVVTAFGDAHELALRLETLTALGYKAYVLSERGFDDRAAEAFDEVLARVGDAQDPVLREAAALALFNKGHMLDAAGCWTDALAALDAAARFGEHATGDEAPTAPAVELGARSMRMSIAVLKRLERWDDAIRRSNELVARYGASADGEVRDHVAAAVSHKLHTAADRNLRGAVDEAREAMVARFGDARELSTRLIFLQAMIRAGTYYEHRRRPDVSREIYRDILARFPEPEQDDIDELVGWTRTRMSEFDRALAASRREAVAFVAGGAIGALLGRRRK